MSFSELHQADFQRLQQVKLIAQTASQLDFEVDEVPLAISVQDAQTLRLRTASRAKRA